MVEDPLCPHAPSIDANDLGTEDCSSARRNLLSPSTYGLFKSAWKSRGQCVTLRSLTSQSTVNFAPVTWSNCDWTTFTREQMCGVERLLSKRRQVDQFSSRFRSSRGIPLKPGYQRCGPPAPDTSSQREFMPVLTFRSASMPGWCIAGLKASARVSILRHALDAPHEGCPDLSQDRKPACSPTSARPYQVGKHRPISRD